MPPSGAGRAAGPGYRSTRAFPAPTLPLPPGACRPEDAGRSGALRSPLTTRCIPSLKVICRDPPGRDAAAQGQETDLKPPADIPVRVGGTPPVPRPERRIFVLTPLVVLGGELAVPCSPKSAHAGLNPLRRAEAGPAGSNTGSDWTLRNRRIRTPSGPEGSSGKYHRLCRGSI